MSTQRFGILNPFWTAKHLMAHFRVPGFNPGLFIFKPLGFSSTILFQIGITLTGFIIISLQVNRQTKIVTKTQKTSNLCKQAHLHLAIAGHFKAMFDPRTKDCFKNT